MKLKLVNFYLKINVKIYHFCIPINDRSRRNFNRMSRLGIYPWQAIMYSQQVSSLSTILMQLENIVQPFDALTIISSVIPRSERNHDANVSNKYLMQSNA